MAKITRKAAKVFGSTAGFHQISQFGSLAAASPAYTTDPDVIQALSNYLAGWFSGVLGANSPAIEDMNALCYLFAYQIAYGLQTGIAEWNSTTPYFIGSVVNDTFGNLYGSITDNNTGNAVTDTTNWRRLPPSSAMTSSNYSLSAAVAANALTVTLKDLAGGTLNATTDVSSFAFRSTTTTSGTVTLLSVTSGLTITIPSGVNIGILGGAGIQQNIYVYAINNAGTVELALSGNRFNEGSLVTTTAIASGNDFRVMYSTTARTSVACRLLGVLSSTQATMGTWATAPDVYSSPITQPPGYGEIAVRADTANGYGSINTKIRNFTTTTSYPNTNGAIVGTASATLGYTFTINQAGLYMAMYYDNFGATVQMGISQNTTQPTVAIASISSATRLNYASTNGGGPMGVSAIAICQPGDVLRAHTDGTVGGSVPASMWVVQIMRLAN